MRYFRFTGDAGLAGTCFEQFYAFEDEVSVHYLDEIAYDIAWANAEMYGDVRQEGEYEYDDNEDVILAEDISYGWEEITEEEIQ